MQYDYVCYITLNLQTFNYRPLLTKLVSQTGSKPCHDRKTFAGSYSHFKDYYARSVTKFLVNMMEKHLRSEEAAI